MRGRWRSVIVLLVAMAAIVLTPAVATACRITNASLWGGYQTVDMYAWFSCGQACGAYYHVKPGKSVAYPDTPGNVEACIPPGALFNGDTRREHSSVQVDASGELRFKLNGNGDKVSWDVYLADDNFDKTVQHQHDYHGEFSDSTFCWSGSP